MNHFLLIKGSAGTVPLSSWKGEGMEGEGKFAGVWREEEEGLEETECETTQEKPRTKSDWKTRSWRGEIIHMQPITQLADTIFGSQVISWRSTNCSSYLI